MNSLSPRESSAETQAGSGPAAAPKQAPAPAAARAWLARLGSAWSRWRWLACLLPPAAGPWLAALGLPPSVARGLGLLGLALVGWATGWLHPSLVALLVLVLVPLLGLGSFDDALVGFGQSYVWLFVATFVIAGALESTGLGRRIALWLLGQARGHSRTTLLALFVAAAVLGFMVPSTAGRSAILLPLCASLVRAMAPNGPAKGAAEGAGPVGSGSFARAVFLGVGFVSINTAWALMTASISSVYTAGALARLVGYRWNYLTWLLACLPLLALFVVGLWYWMVRLYPPEFREVPGGLEYLRQQRAQLGPLRGAELRTVLVLGAMVALWLSEPRHRLPVPHVGLAAALALAAPVVGVMDWEQALRRVNWDVIIQFGAAYSLTTTLAQSGAGQWLARAVTGLFPRMGPAGAAVLVIATVTLIRLGFANMLAMVSMFLPVAVGLARAWHLNPVWLAHVALVAAGFAFFLPAQTPTTAMAYGYGYFTIPEMRRAGIRAWALAAGLTLVFALGFWPRLGVGPYER